MKLYMYVKFARFLHCYLMINALYWLTVLYLNPQNTANDSEHSPNEDMEDLIEFSQPVTVATQTNSDGASPSSWLSDEPNYASSMIFSGTDEEIDPAYEGDEQYDEDDDEESSNDEEGWWMERSFSSSPKVTVENGEQVESVHSRSPSLLDSLDNLDDLNDESGVITTSTRPSVSPPPATSTISTSPPSFQYTRTIGKSTSNLSSEDTGVDLGLDRKVKRTLSSRRAREALMSVNMLEKHSMVKCNQATQTNTVAEFPILGRHHYDSIIKTTIAPVSKQENMENALDTLLDSDSSLNLNNTYIRPSYFYNKDFETSMDPYLSKTYHNYEKSIYQNRTSTLPVLPETGFMENELKPTIHYQRSKTIATISRHPKQYLETCQKGRRPTFLHLNKSGQAARKYSYSTFEEIARAGSKHGSILIDSHTSSRVYPIAGSTNSPPSSLIGSYKSDTSTSSLNYITVSEPSNVPSNSSMIMGMSMKTDISTSSLNNFSNTSGTPRYYSETLSATSTPAQEMSPRLLPPKPPSKATSTPTLCPRSRLSSTNAAAMMKYGTIRVSTLLAIFLLQNNWLQL